MSNTIAHELGERGGTYLKSQLWLPSVLFVLLVGMTGCSGNNRSSMNEHNNNHIRPMGYYSNENHPNRGAGLLSDNDGPLVEMMDHTLGAENEGTNRNKQNFLQTRDANGNPGNPTKPLASEDTFFKKDNRFSTGDANYHGHLSQNTGNTGFSASPEYIGKISDQIRNKAAAVKNVRDVRSVVYGSSVLIAVDLIDKSKANSTKKAIRKAVKPYANGRSITVISDEGTFSRNRNLHNDIREGGAR